MVREPLASDSRRSFNDPEVAVAISDDPRAPTAARSRLPPRARVAEVAADMPDMPDMPEEDYDLRSYL